MTLGELLNKLAGKAGLQNNPGLVSLLSDSNLANTEVGADFANGIDTALMSLAGAKNNPDVQKHFRAETLNTIDAQLSPFAKKYGFDTEFEEEKSTFKRIDLLESKLAALIAAAEAKAGKGEGGAEVEKLKKDLLAMQNQLTTITAAKDKELAELRESHAKSVLDMLIGTELKGKHYANEELGDTNVTIARTLLDEALKSKGAILVNEDGKIAIKRADNTTLSLLDASNNPVQFSDFTNQLLADKKLLAVTDEPKKPSIPTTVTVQPGGGQNTAKFDSAFAQSMADLND